MGGEKEAKGGGSNSGSVDELLVHLAETTTEDGAEADEKHAADLMIVVHQKFQLGPRNAPDEGGLGRENTGRGGAGVENRDFPERVPRLQLGEFELGILALAADREFACDNDVHFSKLGALIHEVVRGFDRDEFSVPCQRGAGLIAKVLGDTAGR